jgi:hypothetical protein
MKALEPLPYFTATTDGALKVIAVLATDTLPAGTITHGGLAYHPDGSLYVVVE